MTPIALPTYLAPIASFCSNEENKFTLQAVHFVQRGDQTWTAEATDTKSLIRVDGHSVIESEDSHPPYAPGFADFENSGQEGLIPSESWTQAFASASKLVAKCRQPRLQSVLVKLSETEARFSATNLDKYATEFTRLCEGRFPPVSEVLTPSSKAKFEIKVDPFRLASLLQNMGKIVFPKTKDDASVTIEFFGENKPLQFRASNPELKATGMLMPLFSEKKKKEDQTELVSIESDNTSKKDAEIARLNAEVASLEAKLVEMARNLNAVEHKCRELVEERERLQQTIHKNSQRSSPKDTQKEYEEPNEGLVWMAVKPAIKAK